MTAGTLYIVPTPIGNLEDITLRALHILQEVDCICAEDTRHSRKLLTHFGITTRCISYYREKEQEKTPKLLQLLREGKNLALISDAGTPAVSDPGAILVRAVHKAGFSVVPLPGASAVTTAVSAAGITENGYLFLGFPPAKSGARRTFLQELYEQKLPVVLYESPRRMEGLLADALEVLGEREVFLGRELSKAYEEVLLLSLSQLLEIVREKGGMRGECVLIIFPGEKEEMSEEDLRKLLAWHRDNSDMTVRDISKKLAVECGIARSEVYRLALQVWKSG